MALWRYDSNGILDAEFNGVGYVVHNNAAGGNDYDIGIGITIDTSGNILVSGYSINAASNGDMAIWRYDSNGNLDTEFNGEGYVVHDSAAGGNGYDIGIGITTDTSGKILVSGLSNNGANDDMAIWRYNSNGTLDTTFNGVGYVVHNNAAGGNGSDMSTGIALDTSGKILVSGYSFNGQNKDMVIWRYNSNGDLDTTFNGVGYVVHNNAAGGNSDDYGESIAIDTSGKILVSGSSENVANDDMAIWRYR